MIINDSHILRTGLRPDEADPVLVVDPNAVLPLPLTLQRFEVIPRRHGKLFQPDYTTQLVQPASGTLPKGEREAAPRHITARSWDLPSGSLTVK